MSDDKQQRNIKIWDKTLEKLRLISALSSKTIVQSIDEMADQRLAELKESEADRLKLIFSDVRNE